MTDETSGLAFLDNVPIDDVGSNLISSLDFTEGNPRSFSAVLNDTLILMTADERYFLLGNISKLPDFSVSFDYQEVNVSQIPEPLSGQNFMSGL